MTEWTKRDQARVDFLNAAVAYQRASDAALADQAAPVGVRSAKLSLTGADMSKAWEAYRELLDGKAENGELDSTRWYCPHCGAHRPPWDFQLVGLVSMGIGAIQYLNVICGNEACKKLITVMGVGFMPEAAAIAAAQQQMNAKKGGHA